MSVNFGNLFKIALRALSNNKFRGFLTMLGIIIGVASVITMLAIGQGSKRSIQDQISQMGSNMLSIDPGMGMMGGVRQDPSSMQTLKFADYQSIVAQCHFISAATPVVNASGQVIYGAKNAPTSITGVNPDFLNIRKYSIADGEMFSLQNSKQLDKVCVIGHTVDSTLFSAGENPIGKIIRFKNTPFRVIGVLTEKGYSMGQDQDNIILAPYSTVQKRILAINYLNSIMVSATNESVADSAKQEIVSILRANHHLSDSQDNDFSVRSQKDLITMLSSTSDLMTILLAAIAGISLLVGGIGIMNIMYVSVTERTREIGLRMSIGARGMDILLQFLFEAILLSVTGGIIGVVVGIGASLMVQSLFAWPIFIQWYTVFLSFAVCTATGIFFGWYPARKAANLDPIEAIRYE